MFTIKLHNLIFFAHHGVHAEENILGNTYELNVVLSLDSTEEITGLEQTVNYAAVYSIIKQRMLIPTPLLETVAQDLTKQIHELDERISSTTVSITKKDPPVPNMQGSVTVTFKKDY